MKTIRYYNTISIENIKNTKHVPPANKEWKNSVYSYNKNLLNYISINDESTYYTMKSYLNSSFLDQKNKKSMRMRSYIRRSSTKKVFVSKPEIKQTTNKAVITLYIFDRESQLFKPNVFVVNKFLKKSNFFLSKNSLFKNNFLFKKLYVKRNYIPLEKYSKGKKMTLQKTFFLNKKMGNFKVNYNLLPKLLLPSFVNKQLFLRDFFIYSFLKWILEKNFGLTINKYIYCTNCKRENIEGTNCLNCNGLNLTKLVLLKDKKELLSIDNFNLNDLKKLNIVLSKYLNNYLSKFSYKNKSTMLYNLFVNFRVLKKNYFYKNILKKEYDAISTFTKSNFSNYKNTILLSRIKKFINNIIFKKIEFNLVNMKYLHLNSDILMEALATKLRKKLSLLGVLKRSLFLVKKPSKFSGMLENKDSLNRKKVSQISNNNLYNIFIKKHLVSDQYNFNTVDNITNSLKYKWISGIKLEAKGRLTKRYTASRAVYKFVVKGNLRNLDKLYNTEFDLATPNVHLIRNQFKPNLQHTYTFSHKRIGTFGLKGWISSV